MDLGNKIKNIRYRHNISQVEMAKILEINRNYLSRIETNKSLPTAEILVKLAEYFNLSIDSLLEVNADNKKVRINKIKEIDDCCKHLSDTDLDFIIKLLKTMTNQTQL